MRAVKVVCCPCAHIISYAIAAIARCARMHVHRSLNRIYALCVDFPFLRPHLQLHQLTSPSRASASRSLMAPKGSGCTKRLLHEAPSLMKLGTICGLTCSSRSIQHRMKFSSNRACLTCRIQLVVSRLSYPSCGAYPIYRIQFIVSNWSYSSRWAPVVSNRNAHKVEQS